MKFDEHLAEYLYEKKSLRLEGLGTFALESQANVPGKQEKEIYYPIEGLSFIYNPKSDTDEDLIIFLVKKLHKIQPLIRSDIESYLSNIKQFINLGKPYTIEGVGTLNKNNIGTYEFTPGNFLPVKEELNPRRENEEHNYPIRSHASGGKTFVTLLIVIAAIAAVGGIGWGVLNFLANKQSSSNIQKQGTIDTLTQNTPDTSIAVSTTEPILKTKSITTISNAGIITDSANYKMIFEVTDLKARAYKRTMQLNSYNTRNKYDTIHQNNIVKYRLFVPVRIRSADTTRVKDSLSIFLGSKIFIEQNNQ